MGDDGLGGEADSVAVRIGNVGCAGDVGGGEIVPDGES